MSPEEKEELAFLTADSYICYQDTETVAEFLADNMPEITVQIFGTLETVEIIEKMEHPYSCQLKVAEVTKAIAISLLEVEQEVFDSFVVDYYDGAYKGSENEDPTRF
jgi:phosphoribosylanthranilate isomerase